MKRLELIQLTLHYLGWIEVALGFFTVMLFHNPYCLISAIIGIICVIIAEIISYVTNIDF